MDSHLLSWIVFTPVIGSLAIMFMPKSLENTYKWVALGATILVVYSPL